MSQTDSHTRMPSSTPDRHPREASIPCFSVTAHADPSVMPRIMEVFAKRGLVPSHWHSRIVGSDGHDLQVDLQMAGMEASVAEQIAQVIRQIIYVERVLTSFKQSNPSS